MEELIKMLPVSGPVGVVCIVVVIAFLRHLKTSDARAAVTSAHTSELLVTSTTKIAAEAREERQSLGHRMDEMVDKQFAKHTEALEANTRALTSLCLNCEETRKFIRSQHES